jgi:hypothetical protein
MEFGKFLEFFYFDTCIIGKASQREFALGKYTKDGIIIGNQIIEN